MANALQSRMYKASPELEAIVGASEISRTDATRKIWDYIKANNLQDSTNRRMINPDEKLGKVLGNEQINMMQIAKKLSDHLS